MRTTFIILLLALICVTGLARYNRNRFRPSEDNIPVNSAADSNANEYGNESEENPDDNNSWDQGDANADANSWNQGDANADNNSWDQGDANDDNNSWNQGDEYPDNNNSWDDGAQNDDGSWDNTNSQPKHKRQHTQQQQSENQDSNAQSNVQSSQADDSNTQDSNTQSSNADASSTQSANTQSSSADAPASGHLSSDIFANTDFNGDAKFKQQCLDIHNDERSTYGIGPVTYNDDLAAAAKTWAEQLVQLGSLSHSPNRHDVGENVGYRTHRDDVDNTPLIIGAWIAEKQYFENGNYPNISTTGNPHDDGHFSQVIWATTKEIGCAIVDGGSRDYMVCQYAPAGNVVGYPVY